MQEQTNKKALWIFENFRETINVIPQKYRGRAWEILIEYGFNNEIDLSKENNFVKLAVKSLLPLMRLRGVGGSQNGKSNNPSGKNKANIGANVGVNVGANVGATPLITEKETETEKENINIKENKTETKTKIFIRPSLQEVEQYCTERNNNINAQYFISYYDAKGWMIGKNKVKDWKACIRTWELRNKKNNDKNKAKDILRSVLNEQK